MATFNFKTENNVDINKKPRVYFTCHPYDFENNFKKICDDIFKTHDCVIYYTENMEESIAEDEKEVDLGRNNLFVIPITYKLLTTPNRAMDEDIPYALKKHIPILPIMVETGIDEFYSKPDKFGELQYLNPYSTDITEISYEDKLKKYLEATLISDELAKRVRDAFDAYIFLSYRKKDRKYANELMRLIHANPECRDIAIWFDEFLTPGESFKDSIDKILHSSKFFTLLVTPNLLEEPDGKPNFVMAEEYPAARESGIDIFPAEMECTDKKILKEKFKDIPDCVNVKTSNFNSLFLETLSKVAIETNNSPEHNFLIGLAYLDGIDVEVNRDFALELITSAAESNLIEAMKKLYTMYRDGIGTNTNYQKAVEWADRIYKLNCKKNGEKAIDSIEALDNLANSYGDAGDYQKELELKEVVCELYKETEGEGNPITIESLSGLAMLYSKFGYYQKSIVLAETTYNIARKNFVDDKELILLCLSNLAQVYGDAGELQKALELKEEVYKCSCVIYGEESIYSSLLLNNLAYSYGKLGEYKKKLELTCTAYEQLCKKISEDHPATLTICSNLAVSYLNIGDYNMAKELIKSVYDLRCKKFGENHPDTLVALNIYSAVYNGLGDYPKKFEYSKKVYKMRCKILGYKHPETIRALHNYADSNMSVGYCKKAVELMWQAYNIYVEVFGKNHFETLEVLRHYELFCKVVKIKDKK